MMDPDDQKVQGLMDKYPALTRENIKMYLSINASDEYFLKCNNEAMVAIDAKLEGFIVPQPDRTEDKELRLVLLGDHGSGKSATGNLLLGEERFMESSSSEGGNRTIQVETTHLDTNGLTLKIIDMPGFSNFSLDPQRYTKFSPDIDTEFAKMLDIFSEGIHVFLYFINVATPRITEKRKNVFEAMKEMFGEQFCKNCFFILTHGDSLKGTLAEYLEKEEGSDLWQILVKDLNKKGVVVENSDKREYVRAKSREQIIKMSVSSISSVYQGEFLRQLEKKKQKQLDVHPVQIRNTVQEMDKTIMRGLTSKTRAEIEAMNDISFCESIVSQVVMPPDVSTDQLQKACLEQLKAAKTRVLPGPSWGEGAITEAMLYWFRLLGWFPTFPDRVAYEGKKTT